MLFLSGFELYSRWVPLFNMYQFISKRFTNQELIWQCTLTDNMQSGGSCSVCKRRKSTSLVQIIYHSGAILSLVLGISNIA